MKSWYHSHITLFLAKTLLIYILWYLIYELWLLPDGRVDQWVTISTVGASSGILELMHLDHFTDGRIIGLQNAPGLHLVDGCSGISSMGLFVGFIIAYPGRWIQRFLFIPFGVLVVYAVNVLRIVVLAIVQVYWKEAFDVMHDYSTTAVFYMVIFLLWIVWANLNDYTTANTEKELVADEA